MPRLKRLTPFSMTPRSICIYTHLIISVICRYVGIYSAETRKRKTLNEFVPAILVLNFLHLKLIFVPSELPFLGKNLRDRKYISVFSAYLAYYHEEQNGFSERSSLIVAFSHRH